ncbi:ATP-binding protein [Streptomyces thermospinosisporus]|uniref:ATP-binding protein n=1 Tax=Streptomyces thermospinosisporus TaxID=161482 RepID=UPI003CD096B5
MTQHQLTGEAAQSVPTPAPDPTHHHLTLRLSSTRRGARLARQLAVQQFTEWTGLPYDSDAARAVALVTAELAANAVRHGGLPGRDFRLVLLLLPHTLRIEVTDTRPERLPVRPAAQPVDETSGRGLLLVQACAERWGWTIRDAFTKTVWAEVQIHPAS